MKTAKWIGKLILAGLAAIVLLSVGCLLYYNVGIHYTSGTSATDYTWAPNTFYSRGTEGFACGRTDSNGYNNLEIPKQIDVLLMGSSQMEAFCVAQEKNVSSRLNAMFQESDTPLHSYSIGISGHTFLHNAKNLSAAIKEFQPTKYVVIVTDDVSMDSKSIETMLSGNMESIPSYNSGILFQLQKIPYLKLIYSQYLSWKQSNQNLASAQVTSVSATTSNETIYDESVSKLVEYIESVASTSDVDIIIVYQPQVNLDSDGTAFAITDEKDLAILADACNKQSITFIDMTDVFINGYENNHVLPHGFCNTVIGSGHLNEYGLSMISETLFSTICGMENKA